MSKQSSDMYKMARQFGKMASQMRDMEVMMSGNPELIMARMINKTMYSQLNKQMRQITKSTRKKGND